MIIIQSSSTSLICWYAKAAHSRHVSHIFFVFHRQDKSLYLSPQELTKTKITASNKGVWAAFIYCTYDR